MNFIYRINGEERPLTEEERKQLYRQFVTALGYRPVQEDKKKRKPVNK